MDLAKVVASGGTDVEADADALYDTFKLLYAVASGVFSKFKSLLNLATTQSSNYLGVVYSTKTPDYYNNPSRYGNPWTVDNLGIS